MSTSPVQDQVGYLVKQLQQEIRNHLDRLLARHDVTMATYPALAVLAGQPGLSNAELARQCFVTPQTMHRIVADLEDAQRVQRRPDPEHGRIQQLHLTPAGTTLVAACQTEVDTLHHHMLGDLTAAEVDTLTRLLTRCLDGLGTTTADR